MAKKVDGETRKEEEKVKEKKEKKSYARWFIIEPIC
jgi:hypothetical protein